MIKENFTYIRFKILSEKKSDLELSQKILDIINELERHYYEGKTIKHLGDQYFQKEITLNEISNYLTKRYEDVIVFSDENKAFNFFLTEEMCGTEIYDCLWFSLNSLINDFPKITDLKAILNLLKDIFNGFKGIYAYTEDEEILQVYFAKRSYDTILSQLPFDYQNFVPKPDFETINHFGIPSHYTNNEINISDVPNGFWWINFLNKKQIENLNLNAIENFNFYYKEIVNEDCKMYVLTEPLLNINNKEHLFTLQNIITKTDLITKQEKSRK